MEKKEVVIITGMHRSGTSMISSYLKNCGLDLGGELLAGDKHNPKGYFEDKDFMEFQRKILIEATKNGKGGWPDWGFTEDGVFEDNICETFNSRAKNIFDLKEAESSIFWGWKDPRTTLLLDFWDNIIPDAKYVLIYRNPWEVKNSIQKLGETTFDENSSYSYDIWAFYNKRLSSFYEKNKEKCVLISSNGFLMKPEALVEQLNLKFDWKLQQPESDNFYSSKLFNSINSHEYLNEYLVDSQLKGQLKELDYLADIPSQQLLKSNNSKVSIVIPCFNHGEYLLDAVDSVHKNRFDDYELIIVNDGSDDENTLSVLHNLENEGVRVIHQKNRGLAEARNTGINEAKYDYILALDSDNRIEPDYINLAIEILDNNVDVGVVYSDVKIFGEQSELRRLPNFQLDRFLAVNYIDACAVYRKEIWTKNGGYDVVMPIAGYEDWEIWISAIANGWKFFHVDKFLFDYRVREDSMLSESNQPGNRLNNVEYIIKKHPKIYTDNIDKVIGYLSKNLAEIEAVHFKQATSIHELNLSHSLLKKENDRQTDSINIQKSFNASLNNVIQNLEQRIKDIEESKLWQLKRKYHKLKTLLKFSKSGGVKRGVLGKIAQALSSNGRRMIRKLLSKIFKHIYLLIEVKKVIIIEGDSIPEGFIGDPWQNFLVKTTPSASDLKEYKNIIEIFSYLPKISIIMPVYNSPVSFLIEAIESVVSQVYPYWELCIADDCSTNSEIKGVLDKYSSEDDRIKVVYRKENGHISATSNSALELASGEFVALLDHDDLLSKDALYQLAYALNVDKKRDFIYSDEDKVNENGERSEPHFKPDWCPDNFLARNYITHLACMRKSIVDEIGGFRVGFEGSQDYDLFLRFLEKTDNIYHIPKILYHWRMHAASAAMEENAKPYAFEAGINALTEALERRGEKGSVELKPGLPGFYTVRYDLKSEDLVSIIIPTKDNAKVLETCLEAVFEKSTYKNIEVILINNNSNEKATFELLKKYKAKYNDQFIQLDLEIPFNYSRLMNKAVEISSGEYILLLNNDTEVISEGWIEAMMEQAQRESIGAVGAKLLYYNDTIQHAGVVLGLGGVAGHTFIGLPKDSHGYFYYITSTNNYSSVTAACLMVRKDIYNEVGGFNEELAVEYNDVDFCLKLVEKGYNNVYLPYVELYHYESLTRGHPHMTKESYARHIKEIGLFKEKWQSYIDYDPCYNPNLTLDETHFQIRM